MRPDKFKVWNKIEKRWEQNWCSVYICDNGDVFDDDFMSEADTPYLEIRSTRKKLEIVWFTGLADKNGKEIYEGDVVSVPDDYERWGFMAGEKREIYFSDGCFRLKPKKGNDRGHTIEDGMNECKVIGNRFENPELLNQ